MTANTRRDDLASFQRSCPTDSTVLEPALSALSEDTETANSVLSNTGFHERRGEGCRLALPDRQQGDTIAHLQYPNIERPTVTATSQHFEVIAERQEQYIVDVWSPGGDRLVAIPLGPIGSTAEAMS